ncbi:hypothetical protein HY212_02050 [Candidatus Pacearchaeota archaeon]|nr:hypothetical protein [Candidatus Pacearchaeota archaeon]
MDKRIKRNLQKILLAGTLYLGVIRPICDFAAGADSPFSRYMAKPVGNLIYGDLNSEEKFNDFLKDRRTQIANEGLPALASILTFPFNPDYDSYKYPPDCILIG